MTEKCKEGTEIKRIFQKASQKCIKYLTTSSFRDNKQRDKEDTLLKDTIAPAPVQISNFFHPHRNRAKTKSKPAKLTPSSHQRNQNEGEGIIKPKSSRLAVYLTSRLKIKDCQCASSESYSSSTSSEDSKNKTSTCCRTDSRSKICKDTDCPGPGSFVPSQYKRRFTVKRNIEGSLSETPSISSTQLFRYCSSRSESIISSSRIFPKRTKRLKQEESTESIIKTNQKNNRESCNIGPCTCKSPVSFTPSKHPFPTSDKRKTIEKLEYFKKSFKIQNSIPDVEVTDSSCSSKKFKFETPDRRTNSKSKRKSLPSKTFSHKALDSQDKSTLPGLLISGYSCSESSLDTDSHVALELSSDICYQKIISSDLMGEEKNSSEESLNEDSPYDPHLHRQVEKPTNNLETLVHLVKCSLGTGILAMPQAFANAGLITGVIFTIIIGMMITHCLRMLIHAQYIVCQRRRVPLLSYSESMVAALEMGPYSLRRFAKFTGILVNAFLVILQLGICCVYIVFIAGSIKKIVDPHYLMPIEYHMVIILGPLIAANCIPNLKVLAPFSALANVLIIVSLGIIMYYLATGKKKTKEYIDLWGSIFTFPLFFGTALFALTAVAVVNTLENNMKTPKDFTKPLGVLNVGMAIIVFIYVLVGALGYMFCKSECSDSILLDLPENCPMAIAVLVMYAVAILISYVLQCFVPIDIIWKSFFEKRLHCAAKAKRTFWKYTLRIVICIFTFIIAVEIRRLGLFAALMGIAALGILIPAFLEFCVTLTFKFSVTKYNIIIKDILIFCIGLATLLIYSAAAVLEILHFFNNDDKVVSKNFPIVHNCSGPQQRH